MKLSIHLFCLCTALVLLHVFIFNTCSEFVGLLCACIQLVIDSFVNTLPLFWYSVSGLSLYHCVKLSRHLLLVLNGSAWSLPVHRQLPYVPDSCQRNYVPVVFEFLCCFWSLPLSPPPCPSSFSYGLITCIWTKPCKNKPSLLDFYLTFVRICSWSCFLFSTHPTSLTDSIFSPLVWMMTERIIWQKDQWLVMLKTAFFFFKKRPSTSPFPFPEMWENLCIWIDPISP